MCDFKPGDEVVCVRGGAGSFPGLGWVCLAEGATYTIEAVWQEGEIGETGLPCAEAMVQVAELGRLRVPGGARCGFHATRFRRAQKRRDTRILTEWLSQPSDYDEEQSNPAPKAPAKKRERA